MSSLKFLDCFLCWKKQKQYASHHCVFFMPRVSSEYELHWCIHSACTRNHSMLQDILMTSYELCRKEGACKGMAFHQYLQKKTFDRPNINKKLSLSGAIWNWVYACYTSSILASVLKVDHWRCLIFIRSTCITFIFLWVLEEMGTYDFLNWIRLDWWSQVSCFLQWL